MFPKVVKFELQELKLKNAKRHKEDCHYTLNHGHVPIMCIRSID